MWDSMCCVNLIMCMLTHVCMTHMKTIVRLDQPAPSRVRGIAHLLYRKSVNWRWWCWKEIYAAICQCLFSIYISFTTHILLLLSVTTYHTSFTYLLPLTFHLPIHCHLQISATTYIITYSGLRSKMTHLNCWTLLAASCFTQLWNKQTAKRWLLPLLQISPISQPFLHSV